MIQREAIKYNQHQHIIKIHDEYYDISDFMSIHPGGKQILNEHLNTDCTQFFEHYNHSVSARRMITKYLIKNTEQNNEDQDMSHLHKNIYHQYFGSQKYMFLIFTYLVTSISYFILFTTENDDFLIFNTFNLLLALCRSFLSWFMMMVETYLIMVKKKQTFSFKNSQIHWKQLDREADFDKINIIGFVAFIAYYFVFDWLNMNIFGTIRSYFIMLLIHCTFIEFIYYILHRAMHFDYFYPLSHRWHHKSVITQSVTANVHPISELLVYQLLFSMPVTLLSIYKQLTYSHIASYAIIFDIINQVGHYNVNILDFSGYLKYLIYSPKFHNKHHTAFLVNYSLFMPIYDYIFGTADFGETGEYIKQPRYDNIDLHVISQFHITDPLSICIHPFTNRFLSGYPYYKYPSNQYIWSLLSTIGDIIFPFIRFMTQKGYHYPHVTTSFTKNPILKDNIKYFNYSSWFLTFQGTEYLKAIKNDRLRSDINDNIIAAINIAANKGCKVFQLAMLNKMHQINKNGQYILEQIKKLHIDLNGMKIVTGNTVTAGYILYQIKNTIKSDMDKKNEKCIFLTGSTSNIGIVVAKKCILMGIKVICYTHNADRYNLVFKEYIKNYPNLIKHSSDYKDGTNVNIWCLGKIMTAENQRKYITKNTMIHQFADYIPKISGLIYTPIPQLINPFISVGTEMCYTLQRGHYFACCVGAMVHYLEKYTFHEVGNIDIDKIDKCWNDVLKHGFKIPTNKMEIINGNKKIEVKLHGNKIHDNTTWK